MEIRVIFINEWVFNLWIDLNSNDIRLKPIIVHNDEGGWITLAVGGMVKYTYLHQIHIVLESDTKPTYL